MSFISISLKTFVHSSLEQCLRHVKREMNNCEDEIPKRLNRKMQDGFQLRCSLSISKNCSLGWIHKSLFITEGESR